MDIAAAIAALAGAEPLPDEPTLQQSRAVRPQVAHLLTATVGPALMSALDVVTARAIAAHARYRWLHADDATGYLIHRDPRAHPPPDPGWQSPRRPAPPPLPATINALLHTPGYTPGALLRAHVEVRDATCIGVTCHHSARGVVASTTPSTTGMRRTASSGRRWPATSA